VPDVLLSELPYALVAAVCVALGLVFGSFLNVVVHRLPRGESVASPGSRCPACGHAIAPYDNVPVLSWVALRGRSRCCKTAISPRYPLIELLGGLFAWAVLERIVLELPGGTSWWHGLLVQLAYTAVGLGLIAAAFIDLEHMILPDEITIGGTLLAFASLPIRDNLDWQQAAVGAAVGFGIVWLPFVVLYAKIRGRHGMGLGDAKLLMLAGAWCGWSGALFALLAGAVQGTLAAVVLIATQGRIEEPEAVRREREEMHAAVAAAPAEQRDQLLREFSEDPIFAEPTGGFAQARLPFGPFLVLATLEYMLMGDWIVQQVLGT
jgi:leader peptidase (prepilin peptidase)/N-methyltransferase